ncbi:Lrp/AsnC ligand binding domain-containing protein, partial [Colwellia marinimaniae]
MFLDRIDKAILRQLQQDGFIKHIRLAPEVRECYQVTGEVDFVLLVTVENMQQYDDFCQRYLYSDPNMKNFKTQISMN